MYIYIVISLVGHLRILAFSFNFEPGLRIFEGTNSNCECFSISGLLQCTNKLFLRDQVTGLQIKEFARKNAANALSVANMVMGMASILNSLSG